jgi:hypothetical protein
VLASAFVCLADCSLLTNLEGLGGGDASHPDAIEAGCNIDTTSDTHNCGACGHDCLGATCSNSVCSRATVVGNIANPSCLAADPADVYWADDNGVHQAANTDGSNPQSYSTAGLGIGKRLCAVSATTLFVTAGGEIATWPLGQTTASPNNSSVAALIAAFTVAPTGFWFTDPGSGAIGCLGCAQTGSPVVSGLHAPFGIATGPNGTPVFWTDTTDGIVSGVPSTTTADSGTTPTVVATGQDAPRSLVSDSTMLFWANQGGEIVAAPYDGGAPTTLVKAQSDPEMITSDIDTLYWLDVNSGSVMEMHKTGGPPLAIAVQQAQLVGLAVASGYVYWATGGANGEIRRAPK